MKVLLLLPVLALAAFPVLAGDDPHAGHGHMTTMEMSVPPSTKMFKDAMYMMHEDMDIQYTGDTDADFVRGMIPHHQGAIDMAKIELEHGKNPKIKKLAKDVIKAQEAEIKMMKAWLAKHDKNAAPKPSTSKSHH